MAATIAGHIGSVEANAAIEMDGWATSGEPMRGAAFSESGNAGGGEEEAQQLRRYQGWWHQRFLRLAGGGSKEL